MWEPRALDALEQLAEYMPAAARDALEAMERMASTGFNYGRLTRKGVLWYLPTPKLGLFYLDDGRTLIVVEVVDARRFAGCRSGPHPQVGQRLLRVRGDEVRAVAGMEEVWVSEMIAQRLLPGISSCSPATPGRGTGRSLRARR